MVNKDDNTKDKDKDYYERMRRYIDTMSIFRIKDGKCYGNKNMVEKHKVFSSSPADSKETGEGR